NVRRVKKVDTRVECSVDHRRRSRGIRPPTEVVASDADNRHLQRSKRAIFHECLKGGRILGLASCNEWSPFTVKLLNRDLLDVPQRAGSFVEEVVGLGVHRVDQAAGLATAQARLRPTEQFSRVPVKLIDFAGSVTAVNVLRGDLNRPWRTYARDGLLEIQ